jgi:D-alanyl-D-alanine carboxypeptidase/D-alanyl-D-alanine-endopeptidase (penicillin-binding protein 4)
VTRRARAFVVALAVAASVALVPSAVAGTTAVELVASRTIAPFGQAVTLSGTVTGDAACEGGRSVRLLWRPQNADAFDVAAETTTAAEGSFSIDSTQATTGRYRALVVGDGACAEVVSEDVVVRVRAAVDASVVAPSTDAGTCVSVTATVAPPKPGQSVELQARSGGRWTTLETPTLNGDSTALARPCLGWDDIGIARYRVRWTAQDELNVTSTSATMAFEVTEARWMRRIAEVIGQRPVSVSVGDDRTYLYRRADQTLRTPASNEKLLLAMAMLDTFGPDHAIPTIAAAKTISGSTVKGDLWLLGRGDPIVTRSSLAPLAQQVADAGVRRITGRVLGSTTYFARDWDAPGWNSVAQRYVNRPTALTFEGNRHADPEAGAAKAFTKLLANRGVAVRGRPGSGAAPGGLTTIGTVTSKPLRVLLAKMLRPSWNFAAEVLGKGLGARVRGTPGTIAKGAATIQAWVRARGASFSLYDSSGLSYANRVDAAGIVRLLWEADAASWGDDLRRALPAGGQGTLRDRLRTVEVRAKTGTLTNISALSGWIWARGLDRWIEFSILSSVGKPTATGIEDKIVRLIANNVG